MGRLENLRPRVKPSEQTRLAEAMNAVPGGGPEEKALVAPLITSFLEMCKGAYSIKEILQFLYDRNKNFSFTVIHHYLHELAKTGIFENSAELIENINSTRDPSKNFMVSKSPTKTELTGHLRKVSLFANLPDETIKSIVDASEQRVYKTGDIIIKKDTVGEDSFVLLSGSVGVFSSFYMLGKSEPVAVLPPLTVFGESAAILNKKRTADVVALSESLVLKVNLRRIVEPQGQQDLNKNLRVRLIFHQIIKLHPVFRNLPSDVVHLLLNSCRIEKFAAHKTVIQQGDDSHDFYFILTGAAIVVKDHLPEGRLKVGSYFGEIGALLRLPRTASVVTEAHSVFLVLSVKSFIGLLTSNLNLALGIEKGIFDRLKEGEPPAPEPVGDDVTAEISKSVDLMVDYDFSRDLTDDVDFSKITGGISGDES